MSREPKIGFPLCAFACALLAFASPVAAKTITGEQAARVTRVLEACDAAVRNAGPERFLSGDHLDAHIVVGVSGVEDVILSGVRFSRGAEFQRREKTKALSACLAGQQLVLSAEMSSKGAARVGVGVPLNEVLEC